MSPFVHKETAFVLELSSAAWTQDCIALQHALVCISAAVLKLLSASANNKTHRSHLSLELPEYRITTVHSHSIHDNNASSGPSRGGVRGESFPGPRDVWGPGHRSKILKRVFQMASF